MDLSQYLCNFKNANLEKLEEEKKYLVQQMGKMVLNNDLISKINIIDSLIEEKKNG